MAKCDVNNKQRLFDVLKSKDIVDMANDNNIEYSATLSGSILNVSVKSGVDNAYIVQSLIENAVNNSFPGILLSSRIEDGYINTILFTERVNNTIKDKRNKRIAKLRFDRSIVRNDGEVISPSGYPAIPMANDRDGIIKNLEKQIHQEATNAWDLGEVADVSNRGVGKLINEYYKSDVVSYYDEGTDLTFARVQVPDFLVDIYYNELSNIIKERREKWSSDLMEQSSFWDENGDVDQYNSISTTNTNIGSKAQYSQYLNSLNRPNTNPILQNNQQEQVKKFAELQERLNNKEFTEGAKNVFESSPDLQQAVYEGLRFRAQDDNLKDLSFELADSDSEHDYFKVFYRGKDLTTDGKVTTDEITLSLHNQGYIDGIEIPVNLRNKGLGKSIYRKINSELLNGELKSDSLGRISEDAKRVWESLVKSGEAIKTTRGYKFKETQITPQQKQQSLDAYTDYIARVSLGIIKNPSSGDYNYTSQVKDIVYHGTLPQNKFEKFDKQKGTNLSGEYGGIHFGDLTAAIERPTKIVKAESFLAGIEEDLSNFKPNIIPVILNIENIKRVEEGKNWGQGDWSKLISKENEADGYVYTNKIENKGKDSYVVFKPEQIHVMGGKNDIQGFKDFVQGKQFQKLTAEEKAKTVEQVTKEHRSIAALKDLAHKLAHRIGGKVEFENRTDVDWKGYNQGNTSVINLAYATSETNLHEILAHPIIRAIKSNKHLLSILDYSVLDDNGFFVQKAGKTIAKFPTREQAQKYINENSKDSELYQSLLKELEISETGRKVFEQVKRDYKYKDTNTYGQTIKLDNDNIINVIDNNHFDIFTVNDDLVESRLTKKQLLDKYPDVESKLSKERYTLEEQQEEAIVQLVSLMAAGKLDKIKDKNLISLLKELLLQMSEYIKSLFTAKEIRISELNVSNLEFLTNKRIEDFIKSGKIKKEC